MNLAFVQYTFTGPSHLVLQCLLPVDESTCFRFRGKSPAALLTIPPFSFVTDWTASFGKLDLAHSLSFWSVRCPDIWRCWLRIAMRLLQNKMWRAGEGILHESKIHLIPIRIYNKTKSTWLLFWHFLLLYYYSTVYRIARNFGGLKFGQITQILCLVILILASSTCLTYCCNRKQIFWRFLFLWMLDDSPNSPKFLSAKISSCTVDHCLFELSWKQIWLRIMLVELLETWTLLP